MRLCVTLGRWASPRNWARGVFITHPGTEAIQTRADGAFECEGKARGARSPDHTPPWARASDSKASFPSEGGAVRDPATALQASWEREEAETASSPRQDKLSLGLPHGVENTASRTSSRPLRTWHCARCRGHGDSGE